MKKFFKELKELLAESKLSSVLLTAVLIATLVLLNALVYALTNAFGLYLYSPELDDLTISGKTDALFAGVAEGDEVTIMFCMAEDDLELHDTGAYVHETVRQFEEKYSFINVKYVNMLTHRDEDGALVDLTEYAVDMRGNETPLRQNSVIFISGQNYRVITDTYSSAGFADFFTLDSAGNAYAYNGEEVVASMVAWVLADEHGTAYFTEKHGETADVAFSNMLSCAGYYVDVINLRDNEVPEDADLVVISNPTTDFYKIAEGTVGRSEIERLEDYLDRGGCMYVTLDPYARRLPVLEGFLEDKGIALYGTTDENGVYTRGLVRETNNSVSMDGLSFVAEYADSYAAGSIKGILNAYDSGRVLMSNVAGLKLSGDAKPLLASSASSSIVAGGDTLNSDGGYTVAAYSESRNEDGSYGRIMVVPSIFLTASDVLVSGGYSNKDFLYTAYDILFDSLSAPLGCNSVVYTTDMLENFTMLTANIFAAVLMAIPVVLAAVGTVIIIRRKNR